MEGGDPRSETHSRPGAGRRWLAVAAIAAAVAGAWWLLAPRDAPAPAATDPSVAVLPFVAAGDTAADRDFAEGLGDELLDTLARVDGLVVAPGTSTRAISARSRDPGTVGRKLGVATVMDASVTRDGDSVRVVARLTDTDSGAIRWSQSYERRVAELPALPGEIAVRVASALLGVQTAAAAPKASVVSPAGYGDFVRARGAMGDRSDVDRVKLAISLFQQVVEADAGFAQAQAGLCEAEVARFQAVRDPEALVRAADPCGKAMGLDPESGSVLRANARLLAARGEHAAAVDAYRAALADPAMRADGLTEMALSLAAMGRTDDAARAFDEALAAQPGYWGVWYDHATFQIGRGDFAAAAESFRRALDAGVPDSRRINVWTSIANCHMLLGQFLPAAEAFEQSLAIEASHAALSNLGTLRYYLGEYATAADLHLRAAGLEPDDYRAIGNAADALSQLPERAADAAAQYTIARDKVGAFLVQRPDAMDARVDLAWYEANLGHVAAAREGLDAVRTAAESSPDVALKVALIHARLGDQEQTGRYARSAIALGYAPQMVQAEPLLKALASEPAPSQQ